MSTSRGQAAPTTAPSPIDDLTRLVVTDEIRTLKARYLRLLDSQQWDELAELFTANAHFTLASFGEPIVFDNTQDWLGSLTRLLSGGTTVHQVHQGEIDVADADSVTARWAMTDYVVPSAGSGRAPFYGHGHYIEHYRRIDGSWKIVDLTLSRLMLNSGIPEPAGT